MLTRVNPTLDRPVILFQDVIKILSTAEHMDPNRFVTQVVDGSGVQNRFAVRKMSSTVQSAL
jgi:hypothetical protein